MLWKYYTNSTFNCKKYSVKKKIKNIFNLNSKIWKKRIQETETLTNGKGCTHLKPGVSLYGTLYLHTWINITVRTHTVVQKNNISNKQTGLWFVQTKLMKMCDICLKSTGDRFVSAGVSQTNTWHGEILVTVKHRVIFNTWSWDKIFHVKEIKLQ